MGRMTIYKCDGIKCGSVKSEGEEWLVCMMKEDWIQFAPFEERIGSLGKVGVECLCMKCAQKKFEVFIASARTQKDTQRSQKLQVKTSIQEKIEELQAIDLTPLLVPAETKTESKHESEIS